MSQRSRSGLPAPIRVLALLVTAFAGFPVASGAEEARPVTVRAVERVPEGVRFDLGLPDPLSADKLKALDSAESVAVTWEIEVLRDRKFWLNATLGKEEIQAVATFDPITKRYALERRSGKDLLEAREVGSREEALAWLESIDHGLVSVKVPAKLDHPRIRWRARAILGRRLVMLFVPTTERTAWARGSLPGELEEEAP